MCFNANISITTFIIGIAAIIIGIINNTITNTFGLFYFAVIFMQFIEFFIWIYINNKKINKYLSIIAYILLYIQILLLLFVLYHYDKQKSIILFIILFIYYFITSTKEKIKYETIIGKNGSLQWNFYNTNPFILLYLLFCNFIIYIIYKNENNKYFKFLLLSFMILFSIFLILTLFNHYYDHVFGSIFCNYINIFSLVIIIVSIYKNYFIYYK